MGLSISVGSLAFLNEEDPEGAEYKREDLENINEVLAERGLPAHHEPEQLPELHSRAAIRGFPYSYLHYLRRFYAYASSDPDWVPTAAIGNPAHDPQLEDESAMLSSHLLCHSDAEGYYLPVEFDEPMVDMSGNRIPGGLLGSSYRLREELILIAPKLGVSLQNGELSDEEADRINQLADSDGPFSIETMVWIALYEAARLSIAHNSAIAFG